MGTATSRAALGGLAALAVALGGCGGTTRPATFAWLSPAPPPARWPVAKIPDGARLPYPPSWQRAGGDAGTATAVAYDDRHALIGYLNLTPRQGAETLANWTRFRVDHASEEHDRGVRVSASVTLRRLPTARVSCVQDDYTTATGARYRELACLVGSARREFVLVGAAPPPDWGRIGPLLERAIAGSLASADASE